MNTISDHDFLTLIAEAMANDGANETIPQVLAIQDKLTKLEAENAELRRTVESFEQAEADWIRADGEVPAPPEEAT